MRKTHIEKLMDTLVWPYFNNIYKIVKELDTYKGPVPEMVFDKVFSPEFMARIMGDSIEAHTQKNRRKLDTSIAQQIYHLWRDKNYFDITPQLCTKLINTDLRDLDTFFLRAPYRSLYLSLPKGNGIMIPGEREQFHELMGVYLLMEDFGKPETIAVRAEDNKVPGVTKYLHILACGEEKEDYNDALIFFHLLFWEGKLSESIEKNKEYLNISESLWPSIQEVFNFVTKVLIYINCSNIEIHNIAGFDIQKKLDGLKNTAKKRKLLQRYERTSTQAHKLLDIIINPNEPHTHREARTHQSLSPMPLEKVRGHFKVQRYGERLHQSKVIWIEPYIRGEGSEFYRDKVVYSIK